MSRFYKSKPIHPLSFASLVLLLNMSCVLADSMDFSSTGMQNTNTTTDTSGSDDQFDYRTLWSLFNIFFPLAIIMLDTMYKCTKVVSSETHYFAKPWELYVYEELFPLKDDDEDSIECETTRMQPTQLQNQVDNPEAVEMKAITVMVQQPLSSVRVFLPTIPAFAQQLQAIKADKKAIPYKVAAAYAGDFALSMIAWNAYPADDLDSGYSIAAYATFSVAFLLSLKMIYDYSMLYCLRDDILIYEGSYFEFHRTNFVEATRYLNSIAFFKQQDNLVLPEDNNLEVPSLRLQTYQHRY